jgi:signal transduction histidine kinase
MASSAAVAIRLFRTHLWVSAILLIVLIVVAFFPPVFQFGAGVYLPIHTGMEVFSIIVAWLVFAISWNSNDAKRAGTTSLLGCTFLAIAIINFGHVLSYSGMPDFVTPASIEKAISFSLVTRAIAALAMVGIAFAAWRPLASGWIKQLYLALTLGFVALIFWIGLYRSQWLPSTFHQGTGLTTFKIATEYVLVLLHVTACIGFFLHFRDDHESGWSYLFAASAIMVASQIFNTFYAHPYDIYNLLSHIYRVIAYVLIYRGIFIGAIHEPYELANRLRADLSESTVRLREMSAKVRGDVEMERKRIARSMHDEIGQDLTALRLDLDWLQHHYPDHKAIKEVSDRMRGTIESSAMAMRRIISDLRPLILDDLGITAAMKSLTHEFATRTRLQIECKTDGDFDDLPEPHQTALFRILQESLTNIARHAQATQVDIVLRRHNRGIILNVRDNGRGISDSARNKQGSFGLFGMSERVLELGGSLDIETASGAGTIVTVNLPSPVAQSVP